MLQKTKILHENQHEIRKEMPSLLCRFERFKNLIRRFFFRRLHKMCISLPMFTFLDKEDAMSVTGSAATTTAGIVAAATFKETAAAAAAAAGAEPSYEIIEEVAYPEHQRTKTKVHLFKKFVFPKKKSLNRGIVLLFSNARTKYVGKQFAGRASASDTGSNAFKNLIRRFFFGVFTKCAFHSLCSHISRQS